MPRIFFSHSSQDSRQAIALRQWLVRQVPQVDSELFFDRQRDSGIRRVVRWEDALRQASDSCEAVICLLSENWQASPEGANEYQFAESLNKRVLGARIGPLTREDPTREWPQIDLVGEGTITQVDIGDGDDPVEFLSDGLYALRERIGTEELVKSATPASVSGSSGRCSAWRARRRCAHAPMPSSTATPWRPFADCSSRAPSVVPSHAVRSP